MKAILCTDKWVRHSARAAQRELNKKRRKKASYVCRRAQLLKARRSLARSLAKPKQPIKVTLIKSLKEVLPAVEAICKSTEELLRGKRMVKFKGMLPREFLVNWIYCAAANAANPKKDFTFTTDPIDGDGIVLERKYNAIKPTQHVLVYTHDEKAQEKPLDDKIIEKINEKICDGDKNNRKFIFVYCYDAGAWDPQIVMQGIPPEHPLHGVGVVEREQGDESGYIYRLTEIDTWKKITTIRKISFDFNFSNWSVK
jgi:hypothetical protein